VRYDTITPSTIIYKAVVANAARYYSARYLKDNAAIGDYSVVVDTVYSQVVPSSQSQTPLTDLSAGSNASPLISSGSGTVHNVINDYVLHFYAGLAITPKSLAIDDPYGNSYIDNGGYIYNASQVKIGTVDYLTGIISFFTALRVYNVYYIPAVAPLVIADTDSIKITENNLSFVYTLNITPPPQPAALSVSFMTQGNWYELRDNGSGALFGQVEGIGSGSINYVTGTVSVTLSALPDVGSELIFAWGKKVDYSNCATDSGSNAIQLVNSITKQLSHDSIDAATLAITWHDAQSNATRTITCNSAGVLSGDGTGHLYATTGLVVFSTNQVYPTGTVFTFNYIYGTGSSAKVTKNISAFDMNGDNVTLDLSDTNIIPGSIVIEWGVPWGSHTAQLGLKKEETLGLPLIPSGVMQIQDRDNHSGALIGGRNSTINYSAGLMTFKWSQNLTIKYPLTITRVSAAFGEFGSVFAGYKDYLADIGTTTSFTVHYRLGSAVTSGTDTYTLLTLEIDLTVGFAQTLVTSSVMFDFAGLRYIDRLGQLYYGIDPTTGAGTYGGTINYETGVCTLTVWNNYHNNTGSIISALGTSNYAPIDRVVFRTAIAPIKPSSFSIRAVKLDGGGQVSSTANDAGVISTSDMVGTINNDTGVVNIKFGQWVTAAGNETQPWYNADNIVGSQIFHPKPVLASSIVYNAVSFTFIPLDKTILGLDAVRLPIDGRIPIYRKGDIVLVLNDQTTVGTFTSASTTNLGRVRLAKVTIKDLGGNLLNPTKWSANLDTGVITWGDLSGVSQPLKITDRIEDMAVVADVQITGKIKLSKPLTHAYPANETLVSNVVVYGDLYAHVSIPFDQQTWTNAWSDALIGSSTSAQFNHNLYPIILTNLGTIQERWVLIFNTSTTFNVIGEHVGQIVTGASISNDLSPTNPATNDPYFTIDHRGFGTGWSAGNVLRFNTYAAGAPVWVIQSIAQGDPTDTDYGFCLEFRGDVDAP
jgi:hypothetical protein